MNQKGMTLIEIMIVLAIIALVGGLAGNAVMKRLSEASVQTAETQIDGFKSALGQYRRSKGKYPPSLSELAAAGFIGDASGEAVTEVPLDPWQEEYVYRIPGPDGKEFEIVSKGPDLVEGTEDDISSAVKPKE